MKKFIVAIMAFLYLGTSCGATVYLHFCMGKLIGIGLLAEKNAACARCGMNKTEQGKGCCHDEHKLVKLDKDQDAGARTDFFSQYKALQVAYIPYAGYSAARVCPVTEAYPVSHAPPRSPQAPVYLLCCSFLI